jgi:integrase/recombinase XerD
MSQAKVLNEQELKRVLAVVSTMKHAKRNRLLVMLSFQAGMRAGEISNLRIDNVQNDDRTIRDRSSRPIDWKSW